MTFNEFLNSDEKIKEFKDVTIIKINYNEKIDFLYEPSFDKLELDRDLKFVGLYDKANKKIYSSENGYILTYKESLKSELYNGDINKIYKEIIDKLNIEYKKYILENTESLLEKGESAFKRYIENESNLKNLENRAITNYIYDNKIEKNNYKIDPENYRNKYKEIVLNYIQEPEKTIEELYQEYINNEFKSYLFAEREINQKEYIGFFLQEDKYIENLTNEISNNPSNEQKKKHDIIQGINKIDAQMFTLTVERNNERISFKYPKDQIYSFYFSSWRIPEVRTREQVEKMYGRWDNEKEIFNDIISISYRGKSIYEDKEIESKKEIEQESEDEMFD